MESAPGPELSEILNLKPDPDAIKGRHFGRFEGEDVSVFCMWEGCELCGQNRLADGFF